jgi:hypothetical protein
VVRSKVLSSGRRRLQGQSDLLAVMDAVVVDNEMDPAKEAEEQEAVLTVAFDPCELACCGNQSTGEVSLLVASRSRDVVLLPGQRPVGPNLGIETDVDFVEVQSNLARSEVVDQPLNCSQSPSPTRLWPRAVDDRLGPIQPDPPTVAEGDFIVVTLTQMPVRSTSTRIKQFLCPRGTPAAMLLR